MSQLEFRDDSGTRIPSWQPDLTVFESYGMTMRMLKYRAVIRADDLDLAGIPVSNREPINNH